MSYSGGVLALVGLFVAIGLAHLLLPAYAKAVWDLVYRAEYDVRDRGLGDPFERRTHTFDESLSLYRVTGLVFFGLAGLVLYYAR